MLGGAARPAMGHPARYWKGLAPSGPINPVMVGNLFPEIVHPLEDCDEDRQRRPTSTVAPVPATLLPAASCCRARRAAAVQAVVTDPVT